MNFPGLPEGYFWRVKKTWGLAGNVTVQLRKSFGPFSYCISDAIVEPRDVVLGATNAKQKWDNSKRIPEVLGDYR